MIFSHPCKLVSDLLGRKVCHSFRFSHSQLQILFNNLNWVEVLSSPLLILRKLLIWSGILLSSLIFFLLYLSFDLFFQMDTILLSDRRLKVRIYNSLSRPIRLRRSVPKAHFSDQSFSLFLLTIFLSLSLQLYMYLFTLMILLHGPLHQFETLVFNLFFSDIKFLGYPLRNLLSLALLVLPSRLRCNGHSTLLATYLLHRIARVETSSCSNCGPNHGTSSISC